MDLSVTEEGFGPMQMVKRRMFALRNGVVADVLRRSGSPFSVIFGLTLPQLIEIASVTPHTAELAQQLWDNATTRESRLLAPMLYPLEEMDRDTAKRWIAEAAGGEVSDILCHRLLRHHPEALSLAREAVHAQDINIVYTGLRLAVNLENAYPEAVRSIGREVLAQGSLNDACRQLAERLANIEV